MIEKRFVEAEGKQVARVTFTIPDGIWAESIYLVGDFNQWNYTSHALSRTQRGDWYATIELELGHAYQFRYRCGCGNWLNDSHADAYVVNPYGSDNFVVVTDPGFARYCQ